MPGDEDGLERGWIDNEPTKETLVEVWNELWKERKYKSGLKTLDENLPTFGPKLVRSPSIVWTLRPISPRKGENASKVSKEELLAAGDTTNIEQMRLVYRCLYSGAEEGACTVLDMEDKIHDVRTRSYSEAELRAFVSRKSANGSARVEQLDSLIPPHKLVGRSFGPCRMFLRWAFTPSALAEKEFAGFQLQVRNKDEKTNSTKNWRIYNAQLNELSEPQEVKLVFQGPNKVIDRNIRSLEFELEKGTYEVRMFVVRRKLERGMNALAAMVNLAEYHGSFELGRFCRLASNHVHILGRIHPRQVWDRMLHWGYMHRPTHHEKILFWDFFMVMAVKFNKLMQECKSKFDTEGTIDRDTCLHMFRKRFQMEETFMQVEWRTRCSAALCSIVVQYRYSIHTVPQYLVHAFSSFYAVRTRVR